MQVLNVNNTDFTGKENEYKKSYMSRIAGTGVGAGLAYLVLKNEKSVSYQTKKGIIDGFNKGFLKSSKAGSVDEAIGALGVSRKVFNGQRTNLVKKLIKASKGFAAAAIILAGLIIGGIVDKAINKKRAIKAENM